MAPFSACSEGAVLSTADLFSLPLVAPEAPAPPPPPPPSAFGAAAQPPPPPPPPPARALFPERINIGLLLDRSVHHCLRRIAYPPGVDIASKPALLHKVLQRSRLRALLIERISQEICEQQRARARAEGAAVAAAATAAAANRAALVRTRISTQAAYGAIAAEGRRERGIVGGVLSGTNHKLRRYCRTINRSHDIVCTPGRSLPTTRHPLRTGRRHS